MAADLASLENRYDVYGPLMDEFGLSDQQQRRLRYLLEVPNLVIDGVRRQIALGVYKSREEADAGLRFTLDDAVREIEQMLTVEQFARLKPVMDQAPARSYLIGVSAKLAVAGGGFTDDDYIRLVRLLTQEFEKEAIKPNVGWVATFAERRDVGVYLEKRKRVLRSIFEQAKTFLTAVQMSALVKFEQDQVDRAFDTWEKFRFKVPAARLRTAPSAQTSTASGNP